MRLDHIIVSVQEALNDSVPKYVLCTGFPVLRNLLLIKIGNKMPVAIVER